MRVVKKGGEGISRGPKQRGAEVAMEGLDHIEGERGGGWHWQWRLALAIEVGHAQ